MMQCLPMTTHNCVQCGHPLLENAKFCGQCGLVFKQHHAASNAASRTLLAVPPPGAPPAPHWVNSANKRTMVGLPPLGAGPTPVAPSRPPAAAAMRKTMVGVAMPGIAPLRAGDSGPPPPPVPPDPDARDETPPAPPARTYGETLHIPAFFVPPPAPVPEPIMPSQPRIPARRGAPLAVAALVAGGVALVGGSAIALLWRSAPPVAAQPRISADGKDVLHLTCDPASCKDGTVVSLHNAKATFAGGEADLPLTAPLHIGDNALALSIDRPGMGRDETLKLVVPVAYRVRADVSTMEAPHACITIRIEAPTGTDVRVDGKQVTLDASGAGMYVIDESAATEGPADESRVIALEIPYVVAPRAGPAEKGTVSARIAVAPLRVDAPGASAVIDEDNILIAGRAARGARVNIDGVPVAVSPDGAFEKTIAVSALGERAIDVRSATDTLAPRTIPVVVTRVDNLAEAAKAFESRGPIGYDVAMRDIAAGKTGEPIVVEGDVVEARASGHRTLVLVDDRRGCVKGPCLARVVVGGDLVLAHGETLRAYGHIARAYKTPGAQTVPEVEAEYVVRAKR